MIEESPRCDCHGAPMARNGRLPSGAFGWRCRVANAERMAAARKNPRQVRRAPARPEPMTLDERLLSIRYSKAQYALNRDARRRADVYAERAAEHGTGGEEMIPLRFLWYRVADVAALIERAYGLDADVAIATAGIAEVWKQTTRREYVRLDKADRLLTRLDLFTWQLDDPLFSVGVPAREMVAA
jgi:hypothetical protein